MQSLTDLTLEPLSLGAQVPCSVVMKLTNSESISRWHSGGRVPGLRRPCSEVSREQTGHLHVLPVADEENLSCHLILRNLMPSPLALVTRSWGNYFCSKQPQMGRKSTHVVWRGEPSSKRYLKWLRRWPGLMRSPQWKLGTWNVTFELRENE